jgi:membrane protease YdiL (CAAX protease family)
MTPAARRQEPTPNAMSALGAALWAAALFALEHLCVGLTAAARPGAETDIVSLTACEVLATSIVLFAVARVYAPGDSLRKTFGVRGVGPLQLALSAMAGAGLNPLLSAMDDWIVRRWPYDDPAVTEAMEKLVSHTPPAVLVAGGLVVMPLAHEVFFRGALFTQLARSLPRGAVVLATTILFACSLEWRSVPSNLVLGFVLGSLRAQSGSVLAVAVARLAFSAVDAVELLRGRNPSVDVVYPVAWIVAGAVIGLGSVLAMELSSRRRSANED